MAFFSLQSSFWFVCFILVLSADNYLTTANPSSIVIVTDSLISRICTNTTNPSVCAFAFKQFRMRVIQNKPFATLVTKPMDWAEKAASSSHYRIRFFYGKTNKQMPKGLKERYQQCMGKCLVIKDKIAMSKRPMLEDNRKNVRFFISKALCEAVDVQKKLASLPALPSYILSEVGFLRDALDVIVALCDKLPIPSLS